MNPKVLSWYAFAMWLVVVVTGCSYMAMGIELRWRGVPVKRWSLSFSLKKRIATLTSVISTYRAFKQEREELPVFLWSMAVFGAAIFVVPMMALIHYLFSEWA